MNYYYVHCSRLVSDSITRVTFSGPVKVNKEGSYAVGISGVRNNTFSLTF